MRDNTILRREAGWLGRAVFLLALSGCQALFTTSPVAFLQRDPADLPLEQRIEWARQALGSGDEEAMAKGYEAIYDDASGSSDGELTYLAASLAMELSGAPQLAYEIIEGNISYTDETDLQAFLETVDGTYVVDAAGFFQATLANDPALLSGSDYLLGAGCLLFQAGEENGGDLTALSAAQVADAQAFVAAGLANLPAGDPALTYLEDLQGFLSDPALFP